MRTPDDLQSRVTAIPAGAKSSGDVHGPAQSEIADGVDPESDGDALPIALPRVPSSPGIEVPVQQDFVEAIQKRFGDAVQELDDDSVFLVFGGYSLYVFHNRIEVSSPTDVGDARGQDVERQPEPEDIIEELFRTISLRKALIPLGYQVIEKGLSDDGYYDYVMRKNVSFDSKESVVAELESLQEILEEAAAENSDDDDDSAGGAPSNE